MVDAALAENRALKREVAELKDQIRHILDHTIESDRRLLQYTNDIFAVTAHTSAEVGLPVTFHQQTQTESFPGRVPVTVDVAVGTIEDGSEEKLLSELTEAKSKIGQLENELGKLSGLCHKCSILQEESANMISTIRTLEEQIRSLREAADTDFTLSAPAASPVHVQNRFSPLENIDTALYTDKFTLVQRRWGKGSRSTKEKRRKTPPLAIRHSPKKSKLTKKMPFKSISISGDSHARFIAGLVKEQLQPGIKVSGMCKPGAGLQALASPSSALTPADHCHVLIAGSNDVAAGRVDIIYRNMENAIITLSATSKLVVSTLPHRYDLAPSDVVNKNVRQANHYISELCSRHEGVELLDLDGIRRPGFTRHGMHLNGMGKRMLARLIAERMATPFATPVTCQLQAPETSLLVESAPATPEQPLPSGTIQDDSYADIVKQRPVNSDLRSDFKTNCFLRQRPLVTSLG